MNINQVITIVSIQTVRKVLGTALVLALLCVSLQAANAGGGGRLLGLDALEIKGILFEYDSGDIYQGSYQGHEILFNSETFVMQDTNTGEEKRVSRSEILYPEGSGQPGMGLIWDRAGSEYSYEALEIGNPLTMKKPGRPGEAVQLYNKGTELYNEKEYEDAILALQQAIEIDPAYAKAWNNLGSALNALGRYEEAENAYNQAIAIDSSDAKAWSNLCRALNNQGRYDEAMDACNTSVGIDQGSAKTWNNMGLALNGAGRYDEAVSAFDKSLLIDSQDHVVLKNRNAAVLDASKASVQSRKPGEVNTTVAREPPVSPRTTPVPTVSATDKGAVCDCSLDTYDCSSFKCRDKAQQCYDYCIAQGKGDVHHLEGSDNDGKVCESWPPC